MNSSARLGGSTGLLRWTSGSDTRGPRAESMDVAGGRWTSPAVCASAVERRKRPGARRRLDAHARIGHERAGRPREHGVAVDLDDLGMGAGERRDTDHEVL